MSSYIKPVGIGGLPQGDFSYQPLVEVFEAQENFATLQTNINSFLLLAPALADIKWSISDIKYQTSQLANNIVVHSALVFYIAVTRI